MILHQMRDNDEMNFRRIAENGAGWLQLVERKWMSRSVNSGIAPGNS